MNKETKRLWDAQNRHPGDRTRLFQAVADVLAIDSVLYPGSYIDIAASFVFPSVTYVDSDRRAARFFTDQRGVKEIISSQQRTPPSPTVRFISSDYKEDLDLEDGSFDLLVSLYAGFVSVHCTRYVRTGGWLLANPSHGDVAMASIDPRYEFAAAIISRSGAYRVRRDHPDQYLIPKHAIDLNPEVLHQRGRGVAYTKPAFAYLFQRTG